MHPYCMPIRKALLCVMAMVAMVAVEPVDFRSGIDGLAAKCRQVLKADPLSGALFVFRNRSRTALKALVYDGQGFWLCHKRLSAGRFRWWPTHSGDAAAPLEAHELQVLLSAGDPSAIRTAPAWRRISAAG